MPLGYEIYRRQYIFLQKLKDDKIENKTRYLADAFSFRAMTEIGAKYGFCETDSKNAIKYKCHEHFRNALIFHKLLVS